MLNFGVIWAVTNACGARAGPSEGIHPHLKSSHFSQGPSTSVSLHSWNLIQESCREQSLHPPPLSLMGAWLARHHTPMWLWAPQMTGKCGGEATSGHTALGGAHAWVGRGNSEDAKVWKTSSDLSLEGTLTLNWQILPMGHFLQNTFKVIHDIHLPYGKTDSGPQSHQRNSLHLGF